MSALNVSAGAPAAVVVGLSEDDRRELLAAMARSIEPARSTPLYTAGLALVAGAMLLLPLIYVGLIVGVAYATYWHAVNDVTIFEGRGNAKGKFIAYIVPLIVGVLMLIFMVKPLFARRSKSSTPVSLDPRQDALLFAFVERLCAIVGAAKPVRIDIDCQVNASASFKAQGPFGWMTRSLVLTIGLPLAAGLNVRELAGVLAHEFGHFAQGAGMRLNYIIRSINAWFYRVVNERDSWDIGLRNAAGEFGIVGLIIGWVAGVLIWLTRRLLWCLMMLGHAISSFMSRQMEFDADGYEARVGGSAAFEATSRQLRLLNLAQSAVIDELQGHWRERRICNNIPALVARRVADIPADVLRQIDEATAKQKTAWYESHPSDADRVAAVRRTPQKGIITIEAPASSLFADFDALCNRVSGDFYTSALGAFPENVEVLTADEVVGKREERRERFVALERYFQGLVHSMRPTFFQTSHQLPADRDAAADIILAARSELTESVASAAEAARLWIEGMEKLAGFTRAWTLQEVGQRRINAEAVGLTPADLGRLTEVYREQSGVTEQARQLLDQILEKQMYRLQCALAIEKWDRPAPPPPPEPKPEEDYGAYDLQPQATPTFGDVELFEAAFVALGKSAGAVEELRVERIRMGELLGQLKPDSNGQTLIEAILRSARNIHRQLAELHTALGSAWYPYEHAEHGVTMAKYVVPHVPPVDAIGPLVEAADAALDGVYNVYGRVLSDLASRAEKVEESLGLSPLPAPAEQPA